MRVLAPLGRAAERLDGRSRRERVLLAGSIAVIVLLAWDIGLRAPAAQRHEAALERADRARADIERLQASVEEVAARLEAGGDDDRAVTAVEQRLDRVDERLAERTLRVVSPDQMAAVLRDVLEAEPRLEFVALRNTGVEPVTIEGAAEAAADLPRVYRHRVELVVDGEYFALLEYLERLESLSWRFQWDALQVETLEYPTARVTLSLSTLSLAEAWIGV